MNNACLFMMTSSAGLPDLLAFPKDKRDVAEMLKSSGVRCVGELGPIPGVNFTSRGVGLHTKPARLPDEVMECQKDRKLPALCYTSGK